MHINKSTYVIELLLLEDLHFPLIFYRSICFCICLLVNAELSQKVFVNQNKGIFTIFTVHFSGKCCLEVFLHNVLQLIESCIQNNQI